MIPETAWMGRHRPLLERISRLLNTYTRQYTTINVLEDSGFAVSSVQVQTLEFVLDSEGEKMSTIAARIGISRSTFSNNIKKMVELGYLEKYKVAGNNKDIYLQVTAKGREAYRVYANFICRAWFDRMFELADRIPQEHMETFYQILDGYTEAFMGDGRIPRQEMQE